VQGCYQAPQSEWERRLAGLWGQVLGLPAGQVGLLDNFFHLGGHSLKATRLVYLVNGELGVEMNVREVFEHSTLGAMAALLQGRERRMLRAIERVTGQESYPLSSAQERLYFLHRLKPDSISYNMPVHYTLEGEFDLEAIEAAFRDLIERHEVFRTSFHETDEGVRQRVAPAVDFRVERLRADTEAELYASIGQFVRPFDLRQAPLMRVAAVQLPRCVVLLTDKHHIISDGSSEDIFIREFFRLYQGEKLPAPGVQYKDYAVWQKAFSETEAFRQQEAFWNAVLAEPLPELNLPLDFARPEVFDFRGAFFHFALDLPAYGRLTEYCRARGVSLYMYLLAAFNVLLHRYSGATDLLVGTGVAGRRHPQLQQMIGLFVNMLVMRNRFDEATSFEAYLESVKDNCLAAFDNQDVPFEWLVSKLGLGRDLSRNPIFNVGLVVQNYGQGAGNAGGKMLRDENRQVRPYPVSGYRNAKFDLTLFASEEAGRLHLAFEYATSLFGEETIRRLAGDLVRIMEQVLDDPARKLADIELPVGLLKLEPDLSLHFDF
jgi:hypothetical protein